MFRSLTCQRMRRNNGSCGNKHPKVREIANTILAICQNETTEAELLKTIFDTYDLTMNFEQYVFVGSTIRSYLSWLKDTGKSTLSSKTIV